MSTRSRFLTLLFTDIEGSTSLWEQDPAATDRAVEAHYEVLGGVVADNAGEIVKSTGDGIFATFESPVAAVRAAAAAQRLLASTPAVGGLRVRMGINTGECLTRDGDHYGRAVNKAARLEQAAYGGQVLLSGATAALVRDDLDGGLGLMFLGEHHFDGIIDPERVYQLRITGLDNEHPPLRTRDVGIEALPLELTALVGRVDEAERVQDELRRNRVVSLVGPPGVGKSRLALRVATEVARQRDNGVRFVDLTSCRRIEDADATIATALGVRLEEEATYADGIVRSLRSSDACVILDNCEHLLPVVAPLVDAVVSSCPRVSILTTSRERLGVTTELVWPVTALALPDPDATGVASIAESAAVQLFLERGRSVAPDLALNDETAAAVADICRRCDGLPLALELAAARLESLSPTELLAALDRSIDVLEHGTARPGHRRHEGLREALDASYLALDPAEQRLFDELAAFAGFVTTGSIAAVVRIDESEARDLLEALVRRSLLVARRSGGWTRFRLLESVRQYAREHGAVDDELRARHAGHFVAEAIARGRQYLTSEAIVAARAMAEQFDDFRLAFQRLCDRGAWRDAARLVVSLHEFCVFSMRTELQAWAARVYDQLEPGEPWRAELGGILAIGAWFRGDHVGALALGEAALSDAEQIVEPASTIWARTALLNASGFVGDMDAATRHLGALRKECHQTGDPYWMVNALSTEAIGFATVGFHELALDPAAKAVRLAEEVDNPECRFWSSYAQAVALRPSDPEGASEALERALAATRSNGSRFNEGIVLMEQLSLQVQRGQTEASAATALDLLGHLERAGGFHGMWQAVLLASRALADSGRETPAAMLLAAIEGRPTRPQIESSIVMDELATLLEERLGKPGLDQVRARAEFLTDQQIIETCRRELDALLRA